MSNYLRNLTKKQRRGASKNNQWQEKDGFNKPSHANHQRQINRLKQDDTINLTNN